MFTVIFETASLIYYTEAFASLIGKGLNPFYSWIFVPYIPNRTAYSHTFSILWCIVINPHSI